MIIFEKVRFKNFFSVGNDFIEIELNKKNNESTLIVGNNGSGKSILLTDSISFALYGKPFRSINKPQIVNSINKKDCLVEIEFFVNGKHYLVRRGIAPDVFEIYKEGSLIDQSSTTKEYQDFLEKNILKVTYKSMKQVVMLGSASYVPFMSLSLSGRREFIENLLDIEIFSSMNSVLKSKVSDNKTSLLECDSEIRIVQQKIELIRKHVAALNQDTKSLINKKKEQISDYSDQAKEFLSKKKDLKGKIDELKKKTSGKTLYLASIKKLEKEITEINVSIRETEKHIRFFENNEECPTCSQDLDKDFKQKTIIDNRKDLSELISKVTDKQKELEEQTKILSDVKKVENEISTLELGVYENNSQIKTLKSLVEALNDDITSLKEKQRDSGSDKEELDLSLDSLRIAEEEKEKLIHKKALLSVASVLLKDGGIKTKIVKQYNPVMNNLINKYLSDLNFFVEFYIDENFQEEIKSRFRDSFSYNSFSEGEKMRLNLALLFAWRDIAKMRNSAATNLLILDETCDSSLDDEGIDEFLKILRKLKEDTNVFVISHKRDQIIDKFDNVIKVEKKKNFTTCSYEV